MAAVNAPDEATAAAPLRAEVVEEAGTVRCLMSEDY